MKDEEHGGRLRELEAVRDDVDDVLSELERVTETYPGLGLAKRVEEAVKRVEVQVKRDGRNLYDEWIC